MNTQVLLRKVLSRMLKNSIVTYNLKHTHIFDINEERKTCFVNDSTYFLNRIESFNIFSKSDSLLLTTNFISARAVFKMKGIKKLKMPNIWRTNQQKARSLIWKVESHQGTEINKKFSKAYHVTARSRRTIILRDHGYNKCGSHFHRGCHDKQTVGVGKQIQIERSMKLTQEVSYEKFMQQLGSIAQSFGNY